MPAVLNALVAFVAEHQRCGDSVPKLRRPGRAAASAWRRTWIPRLRHSYRAAYRGRSQPGRSVLPHRRLYTVCVLAAGSPRRAGLASTLIANGESLPYIAAQLGHHSPAFTLAVYGHLMPSATGRGVDRLDDLAGRSV